MRIAHILTRLLRAGSEENTIASCIAQAANGHEVYLIHGDEFDQRYYDHPPLGVSLIRVASMKHKLSPRNDVAAFVDLYTILRDISPDIVHTHQSKAGILGRLAARAARVKAIIHGVHIVPFANVSRAQRLVYLSAEKIAALFTHEFVNVSRGMRDVYLEAGIGDEQRHHVVHSGFDLSRFRNGVPPDDWRELLEIGPLDAKPPVVVMVAALEARKRHVEFIDTLPLLIERHPDVRFLMPGEGPHRESVRARIQELGLERHVKLVGFRTDPEALIALADVCALTSCREGLPRVVMQYLVAGKACVVSDLPGLEEVLTHDVNGLVAPEGEVAAASQMISDLLASPEHLARLTKGARNSNLESWDVRTMCSRLEAIYANTAATEKL